MWVSFVQSVEGLSGPKRLTLPQAREFFLSDALQMWTTTFHYLRTQTETLALSGFQACRLLYWKYTFGSLGPPSCPFTLQILGFVSFPNHMSQFLVMNLCIYTSYWLFSGNLDQPTFRLIGNITSRFGKYANLDLQITTLYFLKKSLCIPLLLQLLHIFLITVYIIMNRQTWFLWNHVNS